MPRLATLLLTVSLLLGLRPAARAEEYAHLKLGNPSRAVEDPKETDNYLMRKALQSPSIPAPATPPFPARPKPRP